MATIGLQLIAALLDDNQLKNAREVQKDKLKPTELEVFSYIEDHLTKYGKFPKASTLKKEVGVDLPKVDEPFGYYRDEVHKRWLTTTISNAMLEAKSHLNEAHPQEAFDILMDTMAQLTSMKQDSGIMDFRDAGKIIQQDYKAKKLSPDYSGIKSGWSYLDTMMGGLIGGDVLSIVGRPAQGKTFLLLNMAYYAWKVQKMTPLIVTPEMKPIKLMQRLSAMHTHKPLTPLVTGNVSTKKFSEMIGVLNACKDEEHPMWIVDGATVPTIEDLFLLCRQLQPSAVYYDGAYLMKHRNPRLSKWERIAETAGGIKDLSSTLNIPCACSYQFNKTVSKKKKNPEDIGLEDIYGSDEIAQLSSIVLGLLEEDSVKTLFQRKCSLLKGRNGESGSWDIRWDFQNMDFSEIIDLPIDSGDAKHGEEADSQPVPAKKMTM